MENQINIFSLIRANYGIELVCLIKQATLSAADLSPTIVY